jgi:hypothetical protein
LYILTSLSLYLLLTLLLSPPWLYDTPAASRSPGINAHSNLLHECHERLQCSTHNNARTQSANAHVGQVKDFHAPTSPQAPSVPSGQDLAKELEAYEREVSDQPCAGLFALIEFQYDADADADVISHLVYSGYHWHFAGSRYCPNRRISC